MKWAEVPRDVGVTVRKYRAWFGLVFVIGGIFGLVKRIDVAAIVSGLRLDTSRYFAAWVVESLSWFLIVANVFAIVIGIMLMFFPSALGGIEARVNRWYSFRRMTAGGDEMHMALDRWVETFPRTAGWIIAAGSLVLTVNYGIVLFSRP